MNIARLAVTLCVATPLLPSTVRGEWYSLPYSLEEFLEGTSLVLNGLWNMFEQDVNQQAVKGPFPCNVSLGRSSSPPNSVHCLRPGDFDVVGALGDSLTAGLGIEAKSIFELMESRRGRSWAAGGDGTWREFLTLPNLLKEFNPALVGYSTSSTPLTHQFNVASVGAHSRELLQQAQLLVGRMRRHPDVDIRNHWKMITINIGHNDFCNDVCTINTTELLDNHMKDIIDVLDYLHEQLPRTFVSIVPAANMRILWDQGPRTIYCKTMRNYECPCIFSDPYQPKISQMTEIMTRWQQLDHQIAEGGRYDNFDDFAVVVQPFTENFRIPMKTYFRFLSYTDPEFFSSDCFHFSQKANALAANGLWNNLLQPVGSKDTNWEEPFQKFLCPTKEFPYVYTQKTSRMADFPCNGSATT